MKHVFNIESTKEWMHEYSSSFGLGFPHVVDGSCWMGKLQHFGWEWKCVNSSFNIDWNINVWLPFKHKGKAIGKTSMRSSCKNHHYQWSSSQGGKTTWLKVNAWVYLAFKKKGRHLKWNYDSFQISKTNCH